jgi:hypothetical protein
MILLHYINVSTLITEFPKTVKILLDLALLQEKLLLIWPVTVARCAIFISALKTFTCIVWDNHFVWRITYNISQLAYIDRNMGFIWHDDLSGTLMTLELRPFDPLWPCLTRSHPSIINHLILKKGIVFKTNPSFQCLVIAFKVIQKWHKWNHITANPQEV